MVIASVGLALKYVYYDSFGSGCLDKIRGLKKRKNNIEIQSYRIVVRKIEVIVIAFEIFETFCMYSV